MVHAVPLPITLDRGSGVPLARQLAGGVRDLVVAGSLPVGRGGGCPAPGRWPVTSASPGR
jgi:hypothetical protein